MYTIETKGWGLHIHLSGSLTVDELEACGQEISEYRRNRGGLRWAGLLDLTGVEPLARPVAEIIERTLARAANSGLACLCIATDSYVGGMQAKTIWRNATDETPGKLIDAREDAQWQTTAEAWIVNRLEPQAA